MSYDYLAIALMTVASVLIFVFVISPLVIAGVLYLVTNAPPWLNGCIAGIVVYLLFKWK